jgi:transcription initiation factor TFIIIB Brf1 subunit/transcription initiation factor TFIIB
MSTVTTLKDTNLANHITKKKPPVGKMPSPAEENLTLVTNITSKGKETKYLINQSATQVIKLKSKKPSKPTLKTKPTKQIESKPIKQTEETNIKNTTIPSTSSNSSDSELSELFDAMYNTDEKLILASVQAQSINYQPGNISIDEEVKFTNIEQTSLCTSCNGVLYLSYNIPVCGTCGAEMQNTANIVEEEYATSAITDCNVNSNGFISMKIVGKGAYGYNRSLLKTSASYSKYRKISTMKELNNWAIQSKKHHIPKNVLQEANDMLASIKEYGIVFRNTKVVMSGCLYYACYNNGISKTPSEIAQFCGIEEKFHSLGDRILHDLNERGIIQIPIKINPISDYVDRFLELLEIHKKYRSFVLDLIARAEKKHIHIIHDSKHNTKAVGAIYMLCERVPELRKKISKERIDTECGISKTTFIRYYNVLCDHYKLIKPIFKKHHIPMKSQWRSEKSATITSDKEDEELAMKYDESING